MQRERPRTRCCLSRAKQSAAEVRSAADRRLSKRRPVRGNAAGLVSKPTLCLCKRRDRRSLAARMRAASVAGSPATGSGTSSGRSTARSSRPGDDGGTPRAARRLMKPEKRGGQRSPRNAIRPGLRDPRMRFAFRSEHPPRHRASGCYLISGQTNRVPVSTSEDASATTSSAFVSCVVIPNAFTTLQRPPL
jgi:hypothetical protein